jgi:hypothetical protein
MKRKRNITTQPVHIDSVIQFVRGERVILDTDLAKIYGIPAFRLNEAVKRNKDRFPDDFLFQLTKEEHGAVMAANILKSDRAVQMSIFVVRAFIKMRQTLATTRALTDKLHELEKKLTDRLDVHENAIVYVLGELKKLMEPPLLPEPKRRSIGFGKEEE